MNKIRLGLIGCGGIMNAHANGFEKMENIDIVAVADPIEHRRLAMAKRFSAMGVYADHRALYDGEKELDAVFIAVPPAQHIDIEEEAIARKWHFKVEKPMTLDPAQAKAIAAGIEKAGIVTAVGFQDRYLDLIDRIQVELPKIQVGIVHGTWAGGIPMVDWWRTTKNGGGQLIEQNIHMVDIVRYLFGEVQSVYAVAGRGIVQPEKDCPGYDVEDHSTAVFTMKNGVVATLFSACYLLDGGASIGNGLTILGREMSIDYSLRSTVRLMTQNQDLCYKRKNDQMLDSDVAFFKAVSKLDIAGVRSPYSDALKSLEACFAAYESMRTGLAVRLS